MDTMQPKSINASQRSKRLRLSSPLYKSIISETPLVRNKPSKYKKLNVPKSSVPNKSSGSQELEQSIYLSTPVEDEANTTCDNQKHFVSGDSAINITVQDLGIDFETVKHEINPISEDLVWALETSEDEDIIEKISEYESADQILPSILPNTIEAELAGKKISGRRKAPRSKESTDKIAECLRDMEENNISARRAAHNHGVRLNDLLKSMEPGSSKAKGVIGPDPTLTEKEEDELVEWIRTRDQSGFPVRKVDLIYKAAELVQDGRPTRFKDGIPGEKWFLKFLSRHPNVVLLGKGARAATKHFPTKRTLKTWFKELSSMLSTIDQKNILGDSSKLGSVDELSLFLNSSVSELDEPSNSKIILPDESSGYINILVGACANGDLMPPLPIFSCRRPTPDLVNSIPYGWGIGMCKDGKINKDVVHNYLRNILLSWLRSNDKLPFILFVDKLRDHMTMDIIDYCAQNGLLIHSFYPNSQNIIQPLRLMIFPQIENLWKSVGPYKNEKDALLAFSSMFKKVLYIIATPQNVRESFKRSGIFPFNENAPDYRKCPSNKKPLPRSWSQSEYGVAMDILEELLGEEKVDILKSYYHKDKRIKTSDLSLYQVWLKLDSLASPSSRGNYRNQDYYHEKSLKTKLPIISRPETYMKVISDGENHSDQISSFGNYSSILTQKEGSTVNPSLTETTQNGFSISIEPDLVDMFQEDVTQCVPVAAYRNYFSLPKNSEERSKEALDFLPSSSFPIKTEDICDVCYKAEGEMMHCVLCSKFFHFRCLTIDEQKIVSRMMKQSMDFDYLCPSCSLPDSKKDSI